MVNLSKKSLKQTIKKFLCRHKWQNWIFLDFGLGGRKNYGRNMRVCKKCGTFQEEIIYYGRAMGVLVRENGGYQPAKITRHRKWVKLTYKPKINPNEYFIDPRDDE